MLRAVLFIILFLIAIKLDAQSINQLNPAGKKTGVWVGYHEGTSAKRYKGSFVEGMPTGKFTYYAKEGYISGVVDFINDSVTSSVMYHENGFSMAKGKFINKKKEGKWFTYSISGDLLNIYTYKNGMQHGMQYTYYPKNKETNKVGLMEEFNCVNGLKDGSWKQYYPLGTIQAQGKFAMGKRQGVFTYFFSNGDIDMKGKFVDNLKQGYWEKYNSETFEMDKIIYIKGEVKKELKNDKQ